ncbi:MAG: sugar phosphate isomerase/epimerase [Deltaproteobacteria bacterium]|nr:sugar phosphate isomerase/epimerase [Deltaproteobacteria bacterium]
MKFAFSTNAFRNFSFKSAAGIITDAGYTGIEIMCDTPHAFPDELSGKDIDDIKESLEKNHLEISNLNAFMMCAVQDFHHPSWIEEDKTFRQARIKYTLDCIDLAADLGARTISTEPGGPLEGMAHETATRIFIEGLSEVLPHAREKGILVLIEPEPDLLIETSDQYLTFLDEFNHPNLGLNFDIGHFYCMGEDPIDSIIKLKDHTRHYHLEDIPENREHRHILPGQGGIDLKGVLNTIEKTGFSDYITVELYPYLDDPGRAAAQARTYIKESCGYE